MCRYYERPPTVGDRGTSVRCTHRPPCFRCTQSGHQRTLEEHLNATISKLFVEDLPEAGKSLRATDIWHCDLCNFATGTHREKNFHLRCHKVSVIDCVDCGLGFSSLPELREHRSKSICRNNLTEPEQKRMRPNDSKH